MFVERLSLSDIREFMDSDFANSSELVRNAYSFDGASSYETKGDKIVVKIAETKFILTDFDYKTSGTVSLYDGNHHKAWIKFMYEKFGQEYKKAFLNS